MAEEEDCDAAICGCVPSKFFWSYSRQFSLDTADQIYVMKSIGVHKHKFLIHKNR